MNLAKVRPFALLRASLREVLGLGPDQRPELDDLTQSWDGDGPAQRVDSLSVRGKVKRNVLP